MFKFFRNIISSTLGTLAALFLVVAAMYIWFLSFLAEVVEEKPSMLGEKTFLVFDITANFGETPKNPTLGEVLQEASASPLINHYYLLEVVSAIDAAAQDPAIAGIFIHGSISPIGLGSGYAVVKEIRDSLMRFRATGKPILAYVVNPTIRDYYLTSVASALVLNPFGDLEFQGLATENVYLGKAFQRFGIGVQTTKVGKYKSAVEVFTSDKMSAEDKTQITLYLDQTWNTILNEIAKTRNLDVAALKNTANNLAVLLPSEVQELKMVDSLGYLDEVMGFLAHEGAYDPSIWSFRQINLKSYIEEKVHRPWAKKSSRNKIAVVYAEGEIIAGESTTDGVGGDTLARYLREVRLDEEVKAVVFRINSPGGSSIASEIIQREVALLREVKPVIVSFGTYAASGGYWIAVPGHAIYAEPITLTGSIGVFGLMFNVKDIANNYNIYFDGVKTESMSDISSMTRPKTEQELARLQKAVDFVYDQFIKKVAYFRNLEIAKVEDIAQGRVWSGEEALKIGLVDEMGGLLDAIHEAVRRAGVGDDWVFYQYPPRKGFLDFFAEILGKEYFTPVIRSNNPLLNQTLLTRTMQHVLEEMNSLARFNDPRGAYARMPFVPYIY